MSNLPTEFIEFNLSKFGYTSVESFVENFYLKAVIDSYQRLDKSISVENDIRDRFIFDFYNDSPILKGWLQLKILHVNWERWVLKNDTELGRADLSFELSGLDFIVECKRLRNANPKYLDEGLKRFVHLEYAEDDEYAGMIGFIISGNKITICDELQTKCKSFYYAENDFCNQRVEGWETSFKSCHNRTNDTNIKIFHLFFDFKVTSSA